MMRLLPDRLVNVPNGLTKPAPDWEISGFSAIRALDLWLVPII
jgi:hypothetical protein